MAQEVFTEPPVGTKGRGLWRMRIGPSLAPYIFVAPMVLVFAVFLVGPIVVAIRKSLYAMQGSGLGFDGGTQEVFVGFSNYSRALTDSDFLAGFGRVALFGIVQVPIMLVLAITLALIIDASLTRGGGIAQLIVFLPYAVPTVVAAVLWGFLYQPRVSPIVEGLSAAGIGVDLLAPQTVLWSIANISVWSYTGINMIIVFAALKSVPAEVVEAARLDGAGEFRIAVAMKLPMILPALALTVLFSIIGTFQLFNEPQVLSTITSHVTGSFTPNMSIYSTTTLGGNPYLGSAMAVILGVITFTLSALFLLLSRLRRKGASS